MLSSCGSEYCNSIVNFAEPMTSALRAMISEFLFFVCIAATCFSGLLLTLFTVCGYLILSMESAISKMYFPAHGSWTLSRIAWLIVEVWFGGAYISLSQAKSFHPVLGPVLMTCFAALSNTLLLTSE